MKCSMCREDKEVTEFQLRPNRSRGRAYACKPCTKAHRKKRQTEREELDPSLYDLRAEARSASYRRRDSPELRARSREGSLKLRYGLTAADYSSLLEKQNGVCAICLGPGTKGMNLAVDHCHTTGKIRGLLCNPCNAALGLFGDCPWTINEAVKYVGANL